MRSYIVIPEGTPILRVDASTARYAASKARKGMGEVVNVAEPAVLPQSSVIEGNKGPQFIPGQLSWADEHDVQAETWAGRGQPRPRALA
jgi:hypothetical protein